MTEDDWQALREKERQHNIRLMFRDLPSCKKCHDHGYWTVIYPRGYSTVRPCDCAAGKNRWGEKTYDEMDNRPDSLYWDDMRWYFGGKNRAETEEIMKGYELVVKAAKSPKAEVVKEWVKKAR